jgi:hypothetical protein
LPFRRTDDTVLPMRGRSALGLAIGVFSGACLGAAGARADESDVPDTPAWNANVGPVSGIGIAILVPDEGSVGAGLELSQRYGFAFWPVIIAPGGRIGAYYVQSRFIGVAMPTVRVTLPVGPLAPFVQGGAGVGGLSNPGDAGLAWLAGGGLMVHFGSAVAIGAEVNYEGITGTGFQVLSIGPSLVIGG